MRTCEEEELLHVQKEPRFGVGLNDLVTVVRMAVLGTCIGVLFVLLKHFLGINVV